MTDDRLRAQCEEMVDTLRGVLMAVDQPEPYPWDGGALKQQIREDIAHWEQLERDLR